MVSVMNLSLTQKYVAPWFKDDLDMQKKSEGRP